MDIISMVLIILGVIIIYLLYCINNDLNKIYDIKYKLENIYTALGLILKKLDMSEEEKIVDNLRKDKPEKYFEYLRTELSNNEKEILNSKKDDPYFDAYKHYLVKKNQDKTLKEMGIKK